MKPTINNIHFVRAVIAKKPTQQEIQTALEKANSNIVTNRVRSFSPEIYTR